MEGSPAPGCPPFAVTESSWRPGVRVARLRASHSYGFVLALVFATFLFAAAAPDESWGQSVVVLLQTATLCVALWTSGLGRLAFVASAGLGVVAIVAVIASLGGGDSWDGAVGLLQALILISTCGVIAVGVFDQSSVNAQSVLGAVSDLPAPRDVLHDGVRRRRRCSAPATCSCRAPTARWPCACTSAT